MQIVVTPSKKMYHTHGTWWQKHDWVEEGHIVLEKLAEPYISTREKADRPGTYSREVRMPKWLDEVVAAINNKTPIASSLYQTYASRTRCLLVKAFL